MKGTIVFQSTFEARLVIEKHAGGGHSYNLFPTCGKVVKWNWGFEVKHGNMENPYFTQMQFSNQKEYQGTSR